MKPRYRTQEKAVTLIELVLAMVLLSVVIMTGLSMELGLRRIYSTTDFEARLLEEATPIVAEVSKNINRGVGYYNQSALRSWVSGTNVYYGIVYDSNVNGMRDAWDREAIFRFSAPSFTLAYCRDNTTGVYTDLSNRVVSFSIAAPANGASVVSLRLRLIPGSAANYTNPEVNITSGALYRGMSLN